MGCNKCDDTPCVEQNCGCTVYLASDCITVKSAFSCLAIETGLTLTETLELIDQGICDALAGISAVTLINTGVGASVYSGDNGIGQKKIRKINKSGSLITVTQNTDDITISIDEDALISLVNPSTLSIPALYVNSLHTITEAEWIALGSVPYKGYGTFIRPFTDTITGYTLLGVPIVTANSSIQNGLDAYVDAPNGGTRLAPQLLGQQIIVQNNFTEYSFAGDFSYSNIDIVLEESTTVTSTTTGRLLDLDNASYFNITNAYATITVKDSAFLIINGDGLFNSGNTVATTTYATGRIVILEGDGTILSFGTNITKYLINADVSDSGNKNDGNLCFNIICRLRADHQGIYRVGGGGRIDLYNKNDSGLITVTDISLNLKAFHQTGGQVRAFEGASFSFRGGTRKSAITFTPTTGFTPTFIALSTQFTGEATTLFDKINTSNSSLDVTNSVSEYSLNITNVFLSPNLWEVRFTNNVLASGIIDNAVADLTAGNNQSSINTIGSAIIETLLVYTSKQNAKTSGIQMNSAFILKRDVNAVDLLEGVEYKIKTAGSPSLGTVGDYFIATGSETGTGVATLIERCVLV